jgi:hypothetical protein
VRQEQLPAVTQHIGNTPTAGLESVTKKGKETNTEMEVDDVRSETENGDEMEYDDLQEQLPEYKGPGQDCDHT